MSDDVRSTPAAASFAPAADSDDRSLRRAWWVSVCCVAALIAGREWLRWSDPATRGEAVTHALCGDPADWLPFAPLFLLLPLAWRWRRRGGGAAVPQPSALEKSSGRSSVFSAWLLCLFVAAMAYGMTAAVSLRFRDDAGRPLPPAFHDEFSYLIQAETFLAGRTWFSSPEPRPELFDQMHVLNEGRFASRYFPGVGLWLAPFIAIGDPWLGWRIAAALCSGLLFWIGRDLGGNRVGLLAGLLFAVSPGLAIFANLLLSHHPTLVGLLLFTWAFLRLKRLLTADGVLLHGFWLYALIAGVGLAYAMLCRPMTAAGVGLPFGIWFAWWLVTARAIPVARRLSTALTLSAPLVAGIVAMGWYNHSITGDAFKSPYQFYTDVYTPRHVYGFHNVERGEQHLGPKVLDHYDRWAEDLTPSLAARNVTRRLAWGLRWTLGIVPLALGGLGFLLSGRLKGDWLLIAAAIASLHAVHVPYWFVGIMHWHYVLESAPFWLLLFAGASDLLFGWWTRANRPGLRVWWGGLIAISLLVNLDSFALTTDKDGTWWLWQSRLDEAVVEVLYPRVRYGEARDRIDALRAGRRAVVLVLPDPADRSMDYVANPPPLQGDVIFLRVPEGERDASSVAALAGMFPERLPILLDAAQHRIDLLNETTGR